MNLPALSYSWLHEHAENRFAGISPDSLQQLPEKVVQFGTGVLLRGLPDYYIDRANKAGVFNGRIVVIKTTSQGSVDDFANQDFLFTHVINGIRDGQLVQESTINTSISRVLEANSQWADILACAANPDIELVVSNTTERGLVYVEESIAGVPDSFPGKLLAFLLHRFQTLGGGAASGLTIIPTELIEGNGDLLKEYVLRGAAHHQLSPAFVDWVATHHHFCNSLVDRIVPGKPSAEKAADFFSTWGYADEYLLVSEPYDLWAIQSASDPGTALSFAAVNPGVVITPDITRYKELKLRLLNATHILSCGKAVWEGISTVREAFAPSGFRSWAEDLMAEISRSIPVDIEEEVRTEYAANVLQRFENPFIDHYWESILLNYASKMKIRALPLLQTFYARNGSLPGHIVAGFAFYLVLSIPDACEKDIYYKTVHTWRVKLQDTISEGLYTDACALGFAGAAKKHLEDTSFWGAALADIPGFTEQVLALADDILTQSSLAIISETR